MNTKWSAVKNLSLKTVWRVFKLAWKPTEWVKPSIKKSICQIRFLFLVLQIFWCFKRILSFSLICLLFLLNFDRILHLMVWNCKYQREKKCSIDSVNRYFTIASSLPHLNRWSNIILYDRLADFGSSDWSASFIFHFIFDIN